jgi:hypothetical protein
MKVLFAVFMSISTVALADAWRPISYTQDLNCTGKATGHTDIRLAIESSSGVRALTKLTFTGGLKKVITNNHDSLHVASEGNVYIQQVSNELGYNLFLQGEGLEEFLSSGQGPVHVKLTGSIGLFQEQDQTAYELSCEGILN